MYRDMSLLTIGFVFVSCIHIVRSQDAEKCFMYRVDRDHPSPTYKVKDNETLHLMFNDDDFLYEISPLRILDGDSCVLDLRYRNDRQVPSCNKTRRIISGKNIFRFHKTDNDITVDLNNEGGNITGRFDTLRVETDSTESIGVASDCHDECFEFENISINLWKRSLFVRKTEEEEEEEESNVDCSVIVKNGRLQKSNYVSRIWSTISSHLRTDCWYNVTIERSYSEDDRNGLSSSEVYGYFQSYPEAPIFLGSVHGSTFSNLDFIGCKGLRFSLCGDSLPKCEIKKAEDSKDCHELENAVIKAGTSSILVRKEAEDSGVDCPVIVVTDDGDRKSFNQSGLWREISQFLSTDCWYHINFTINYFYVKEDHYDFEVYGYFQTSPDEPRLLGYIANNGGSFPVLLDFTNCKGLRFSYCRNGGSDSIPLCFYHVVDLKDSLPKCDMKKAEDSKDCHELENPVIKADTSSILVRKMAEDNVVDCPVIVVTDDGDRKSFKESGFWRELSQFLSTNCWYQINLTTNYFHVKEDHYAFVVYGYFQTSPGEPRLLGAIVNNRSSIPVRLEFTSCKGLRFSGFKNTVSDPIPLCFYNKDYSKECFMYRVDRDHPSPTYKVPENETLHLMFNNDDFIEDDSPIRILDGDSCILGLKESADTEIPGCNKTEEIISDINIFRFRKTDNDLKVDLDYKGGGNITGHVDTLRVETNSMRSIGVTFDCHDVSDCFEFENLDINYFNKGSLFVRKIEEESYVDCPIIVKNADGESNHVSRIWSKISPHLRTDCWYNITIKDQRVKDDRNGKISSEAYGYFQSYPEAPIFLGSVQGYIFTNLDFIHCKGLRFSLCGDSLPKCDMKKPEDSKDCHELENAVIKANTSSILVRKEAEDNEVDCPVIVVTDDGDRKSFNECGVWREISQFLSTDCWNQINFTTNYFHVKGGHYAFEVYGYFQTSPGEPRLLGSIVNSGSSIPVRLDFTNCKGLRFSYCKSIGSDPVPLCF